MNLISYLVDEAVHTTLEKHPIALGVIVLVAVWGFAFYSLVTY